MVAAVVGIVVAGLLAAAFRLWLTANRLDRLHVRTEAAWAVLVGTLARRIVLARALAAAGPLPPAQAERIHSLAAAADSAGRVDRDPAESSLAAALAELTPAEIGELGPELADITERVYLARKFYNDAVRDTRLLRASWFTRLFRLAGHAALPDYFASDDEAD